MIPECDDIRNIHIGECPRHISRVYCITYQHHIRSENVSDPSQLVEIFCLVLTPGVQMSEGHEDGIPGVSAHHMHTPRRHNCLGVALLTADRGHQIIESRGCIVWNSSKELTVVVEGSGRILLWGKFPEIVAGPTCRTSLSDSTVCWRITSLLRNWSPGRRTTGCPTTGKRTLFVRVRGSRLTYTCGSATSLLPMISIPDSV